MLTIALTSAIFISLTNGAELPNYIKKCKLSDPNLDECMTDHANEAIPRIVKGDPDFKLINMSPIVLPEVNLGSGPNLEMRLKQATTEDIKELKIAKVNFDAQSNKLLVGATVERLETSSTYFINGRILVLPIKGEGKSNITFVGGKVTYEVELETKDVGEEKFYLIKQSSAKVGTERAYFHLENLFGGDENLGKQMSEYLDTNWKDFYEILKPAMEKVIQSIFDNTITAYFSKVPINKLFDD